MSGGDGLPGWPTVGLLMVGSLGGLAWLLARALGRRPPRLRVVR